MIRVAEAGCIGLQNKKDLLYHAKSEAQIQRGYFKYLLGMLKLVKYSDHPKTGHPSTGTIGFSEKMTAEHQLNDNSISGLEIKWLTVVILFPVW
jgi:hypothetical protein